MNLFMEHIRAPRDRPFYGYCPKCSEEGECQFESVDSTGHAVYKCEECLTFRGLEEFRFSHKTSNYGRMQWYLGKLGCGKCDICNPERVPCKRCGIDRRRTEFSDEAWKHWLPCLVCEKRLARAQESKAKAQERQKKIDDKKALNKKLLTDEETNDEIVRIIRGASVYLIASAEAEPVKIGKAVSIERRLAELQTGNPHKLQAIFSLSFKSESDAYDFEDVLHRHFSNWRLEGEWFDVSLDSAIGAMKSLDPYRRFT